jgi:hypothetical protein
MILFYLRALRDLRGEISVSSSVAALKYLSTTNPGPVNFSTGPAQLLHCLVRGQRRSTALLFENNSPRLFAAAESHGACLLFGASRSLNNELRAAICASRWSYIVFSLPG